MSETKDSAPTGRATNTELLAAIVELRITLIETNKNTISCIENLTKTIGNLNTRVDALEIIEATARTETASTPARLRSLEDERERMRGMLAIVKWLSGGASLTAVIALVLQIITLLQRFGVV